MVSKNTSQGAAQVVRDAVTTGVSEPLQPVVLNWQFEVQANVPLLNPRDMQVFPLSWDWSQSSPESTLPSPHVRQSQLQNKEKAMRVLRARLYEMKLAEQQAAIGAQRRGMVGGGNRSEKIRTYNFKANRVTDHRINFDLHRLDQVMAGDLDELVEALINADRAAGLNGASA